MRLRKCSSSSPNPPDLLAASSHTQEPGTPATVCAFKWLPVEFEISPGVGYPNSDGCTRLQCARESAGCRSEATPRPKTLRRKKANSYSAIGACFAIPVYLLDKINDRLPEWLGAGAPHPAAFDTTALKGARFVVDSGFQAIMFLFFLVVFRTLLRRPWAAVLATILLITTLEGAGDAHFLLEFALSVVEDGLVVLCLIRFGLLPAMVLAMAGALPFRFPLASDLTAWYAQPSWMGFLVVGVMLVVAFYFSLGGRAIVKAETLDG